MSKAIVGLFPVLIFIGLIDAGLVNSSESVAQAATRQVEDDLAEARDQPTFQQDLSLTNSCIEGGRDKTECLCVTRVLKYELSLREYRLASQIFARPAPQEQSALRLTLMQQGYEDEEIGRLSSYTGKLTSASNFQNRCAEANAYFTALNSN